MSGIKAAEVKENLSKVVQTVRSGIAECAQQADATGAVGRAAFDRQCASARRTHADVRRALPADVQKMIGAEAATWTSLLRGHDDKFKEAGELASRAAERLADFQAKKRAAEQALAQVSNGVENIQRTLLGKRNGWYCDNENAEALQLRSRAKAILEGLRRDAGLGQQVQGLQRDGLSAFAASEKLAADAEREYDRLVNLARERERARRIREENERKARSLLADIESLKRAIESYDYAKFGGDDYTSQDRRECEEVARLIASGRYESGLSRGEALKGRLAAAAKRIETAQRNWEAQKLAAERLVADAASEAAAVDRAHLLKYAGAEAAVVEAAFRGLETASAALKAEDFEAAGSRASSAIADIRGLAERANENARLSAERDDMAWAIMKVLYEANFDTPAYYLQDDGNELSDMCVVAAAPGGVGDMKLRIDLAGHTEFEVCNIPVGHEQLCIDQIRNLQEGLAASDIRFDVTNWGRANRQGKVHIDTRTSEQEVQKQKQIQRQG